MTENSSVPETPPEDYQEFRFPTLTEKRAKELATKIVYLSQFDEELMLLVSELAMGVAPADTRDTRDCANRADAAHWFVSEIFHLTVGFDNHVRAYIREIAQATQGDQQ